MKHQSRAHPTTPEDGYVVNLGATVDAGGHIERLWVHGRSVSSAESFTLTFPPSRDGYHVSDIAWATRFFALLLDGNAEDVRRGGSEV